MPGYAVEIKASAQKELERVPVAMRRRIASAITALADDPRPRGARLLSGQDERIWRIREGVYRIVYQVSDERLVVLVIRAGHRGDVYRGL